MKKILCIDFDGVLHSYESGWQGVAVVADGPVPGAIDWLKSLIASPDFEPVIYSARSKAEAGIGAMKKWLFNLGITEEEFGELDFPTQKPPAFLTIDDRAICFDGNFPSFDMIKSFKPWNKKDV